MSVLLPRGPLDPRKADHALRFMRNLTLGRDRFAGKAFDPLPYQREFTTELFGRVRHDDASRRQHTTAYLSVSRKNGKTGYLAPLALYGLLGMGIEGAEVISAAGSRDQAGLVFEEMCRIIRHTPALAKRVHITEHKKTIHAHATNSVYRAIAADGGLTHGLNPSMVLADELHVWKGQAGHDLYHALKTAQGFRDQPLFIVATTAGPIDRSSIWWDVYDYATKVRDRVIDDPSFLPCIYETPLDADIEDRETWRLSNPALGTLTSMDSLESAYREAKSRPSAMVGFRAYLLNQPIEHSNVWLDITKWQHCQTFEDHELLDANGSTLPTYAGFDAGWKSDFSAFVAVTPLPDGRHAVRCRFWIPDGARDTTHHRPYASWVAANALTITPGDVVDWLRIEDDIVDLCGQWNVTQLAYDPASMEFLRQRLETRVTNTTLISQRQGFALHPGLRGIEDGVGGSTLAHNTHPVLTWMASNAVVVTGRQGDMMLDKKAAHEKVDGIAALSMAMQRALLGASTKPTAPAAVPRIIIL